MPNKLPPDYEALELQMWRKNASEVLAELNAGSKQLLKRIQSLASKFGYTEQEVMQKIKTDTMFAANLAKAPNRTGFHEIIAGEWIQSLPTVRDFQTLPKSGKNAIYITSDGNINRGGTLSNIPGKSLDFKWRTGETTCYAMHKYTKEGGGGQKSQFTEMVDLLRRFQSCNDKTCALFVIVDGSYYLGDRLNTLRNNTRAHDPKSFALPIGELPDILRTYANGRR